MLGFMSDELVWTICLEREEEARSVHPHTARRPDPERSAHEYEQRRAVPFWSALAPRYPASRLHI